MLQIKYFNTEALTVLVTPLPPPTPVTSANVNFLQFSLYDGRVLTWDINGRVVPWMYDHAIARGQIKDDARGLDPGTYEARIMADNDTNCNDVVFMFTFKVE
jgi:hypothetical protein